MTETELVHSKFHQLLQDQIRHEFTASQQYTAIAVYFDDFDLPALARHFYAQALEERNHAMMMVRYLLDRDIRVEIPGLDAVRNDFGEPLDALVLSLAQERAVTDQVSHLSAVARDEHDHLGEQFMQWFLREQVEEVSVMTTLVRVAKRAGANLFDLDDFVSREYGGAAADSPGAPPIAGAGE